MGTTNTDRIEVKVLLRAPRARVWQALADSGEAAPNGTLLTVVESGFDGIPAVRRAKAYEMHEQGWAGQVKSISEYLVKAA